MAIATILSDLHCGFCIFKRFRVAIFMVSACILCWIFYDFIATNRLSVINGITKLDPSCHQVHILDANGSLITEQRCYPLLINFAHGCCRKVQENNCQTGLAYGIRQCLKLNMQVFDNDQQFLKRNADILNRKRGAGYWVWKSYAIYRELYYARESDIIVYSDSAVNFVANIQSLLQLTEHQDVVVFKLVRWKVRIREGFETQSLRNFSTIHSF